MKFLKSVFSVLRVFKIRKRGEVSSPIFFCLPLSVESQPLNDSPSRSSLMASSSSSSPSTWKYRVSFYGPDVPKTFLTHLRKQFNSNGITMFDDKTSNLMDSEFTEEIRESTFSIVVISMKYASYMVHLDDLFHILSCKEKLGKIVMPVFYGVDPSDVRELRGNFWRTFQETCYGRADEDTRRWSQVLKDVCNIPRKYFINRDAESEQIEKIASDISRDISNELNTTICSRGFGDMVGLETHLENILPFLHLDKEDEAMIVGIYGPEGIGKTTIARALYSRFSSSFQLHCFMENVKRTCNSGLDDYALKLGAVRESLNDQKVLIILDDVDDLKQLEAWDDESRLFGPGSRIVVTTEDQELLQNPGINDTYHVGFPSSEKALEILCKYAFGQRSPHNGFTELAKRVVDLCGKLPLRLSVVGLSLSERKKDEWEEVIRRLELSKKRKSISIGMAFLVVINLLLEIASAVVEHLASVRKPILSRISVGMSFLSVVLSGLDLYYNIRSQGASFRWKRPIPWFYYYKARDDNRILGNFTDTVLMFCAVGGFIVSIVNGIYIELGREGPIKGSVWPLFFAIGLFGMVVYKFIQEKLPISKEDYSLKRIHIEPNQDETPKLAKS